MDSIDNFYVGSLCADDIPGLFSEEMSKGLHGATDWAVEAVISESTKHWWNNLKHNKNDSDINTGQGCIVDPQYSDSNSSNENSCNDNQCLEIECTTPTETDCEFTFGDPSTCGTGCTYTAPVYAVEESCVDTSNTGIDCSFTPGDPSTCNTNEGCTYTEPVNEVTEKCTVTCPEDNCGFVRGKCCPINSEGNASCGTCKCPAGCKVSPVINCPTNSHFIEGEGDDAKCLHKYESTDDRFAKEGKNELSCGKAYQKSSHDKCLNGRCVAKCRGGIKGSTDRCLDFRSNDDGICVSTAALDYDNRGCWPYNARWDNDDCTANGVEGANRANRKCNSGRNECLDHYYEGQDPKGSDINCIHGCTKGGTGTEEWMENIFSVSELRDRAISYGVSEDELDDADNKGNEEEKKRAYISLILERQLDLPNCDLNTHYIDNGICYQKIESSTDRSQRYDEVYSCGTPYNEDSHDKCIDGRCVSACGRGGGVGTSRCFNFINDDSKGVCVKNSVLDGGKGCWPISGMRCDRGNKRYRSTCGSGRNECRGHDYEGEDPDGDALHTENLDCSVVGCSITGEIISR